MLERLENYPEMLSAKLLFSEKPKLEPEIILQELRLHFDFVENSNNDEAFIYYFPNIQIEFQDTSIPAQCMILIPNEENHKMEIAVEAYQQNWNWKEANKIAENCKFEVLISDLMTRTLEYKTRFNLFTNFLAAVTKMANPEIVYSMSSQKLVKPINLVESINSKDYKYLESFMNVRLYNIEGESGEFLIDTIGLYLLGLPDFQIRFSNYNEGELADLLWNYAYYIFEQGDVIENGNTLQGRDQHSKWKCERQISLVAPERVVINLIPS